MSLTDLDNFLVQFLATREAVAPLAKDPIILALRYGLLDTLYIKIHLQMAEIIFSSSFSHQVGSGASAKDPIMSSTLIRSFRHL